MGMKARRAQLKPLTTHEAAEVCGVAPMTVIRWIEQGELDCYVTVGSHRRIPAREFARFCKRQGIPNP